MITTSIFSIIIIIAMAFGWATHVTIKGDKIDELREALDIAGQRLKSAQEKIRTHERVPLRTKCWCKHDAVAHDDNGCRIEYPFRWACACQISRDEVYYTPEPMRKMLSL